MRATKQSGADPVPALEIRHASKSFGGSTVLDDVSLEVRGGEVHALLGENGSGKSTLIKIISGFHIPDSDEASMTVGGVDVMLGDPAASHDAGLRFVHQHLAVIQEFSAVENIALDAGYSRPAFIDWAEQARRTEGLLKAFDVEIDIWCPLSELRPIDRAAVAICRAMVGGDQISTLILDEPTSLLPAREVEQLFRLIGQLTKSGVGVIYVTHRLDEVFEIADRVTILKDGLSQGTVPSNELTREKLTTLIVGRVVSQSRRKRADSVVDHGEEPIMSVTELEGSSLRGISFDLAKGEILGVAGLTGSGREEVARAVLGADEDGTGNVKVGDSVLEPLDPIEALAHGLILGLSNVKSGSAVRQFTARENITMASLSSFRGKLGMLRRQSEFLAASEWTQHLDIRPPDPEMRFALLSGGNQQKVILARCLNAKPKVLVLDDPTAGVDVGARQAIYDQIITQAERGLGILICSNDLEDIVGVCDRVLVLRGGRIVAEFGEESDEHTLMTVAAHGDAVLSTGDSEPGRASAIGQSEARSDAE